MQVNKGENMNELENKDTNEEIEKGHTATGNEIDNVDVEENYKTMIEESPKNALLLRNYAEFLCQVRYLHSALNFLIPIGVSFSERLLVKNMRQL